ncbi:40S ribosomal protein S5-1 [Hordeum vulgare]|nr:40S ribosomal protein S5-1 [Hordeum vulgare]
MTTPSSSKDKFFEKVSNQYLPEVMKNTQVIEMHEGVVHIRDVQGPKKEGIENGTVAAMEQEIFKCQGIVDRGLSANHSMIMDFIRENKIYIKNVGVVLLRLQEQIEHLQAQIFDLQSQGEYELRFKRMSIAADFTVPEPGFPFYDVAP